jgi:hypothetical protein
VSLPRPKRPIQRQGEADHGRRSGLSLHDPDAVKDQDLLRNRETEVCPAPNHMRQSLERDAVPLSATETTPHPLP